MSSTESNRPKSYATPRPGVVRALGVCNILFSLLLSLCLLSSAVWIYMAMIQSRSKPPTTVVTTTVMVSSTTGRPTTPSVAATPATSTGPPILTINPFIGMDDPNLIRFSSVDCGTAFLLNGLMFVTGIGLLNQKRWAARWWTYVAWTKIIRLWLFWGFFIVAVAPGFSETLGNGVAEMFKAQGGIRGRVPSAGEFTRIYSIMNLILGVTMIAFGTIYPALSLWLLSRPGVKAALVDPIPNTSTEPELS